MFFDLQSNNATSWLFILGQIPSSADSQALEIPSLAVLFVCRNFQGEKSH